MLVFPTKTSYAALPTTSTGAIVLGDHPTVNSFLLVRLRADDAAAPMDRFRRPNPAQA